MSVKELVIVSLLLLLAFPSLCFADAQQEYCAVAIVERWPTQVKAGSAAQTSARKTLLIALAKLENSAFQRDGYERSPTSFPISNSLFLNDGIVFQMRTSCPAGKNFLRRLIDTYTLSLTDEQKKDAPNLVIRDAPATKYEIRCGVGATPSSCPMKERITPTIEISPWVKE